MILKGREGLFQIVKARIILIVIKTANVFINPTKLITILITTRVNSIVKKYHSRGSTIPPTLKHILPKMRRNMKHAHSAMVPTTTGGDIPDKDDKFPYICSTIIVPPEPCHNI